MSPWALGQNEEAFFGAMLYNRTEFGKFAFSAGGGFVNNPGQYLLLVPPINGATAVNYGQQVAAYDNGPAGPNVIPNLAPGSSFIASDFEIAFAYRPSPYLVYNLEYEHNNSNTPYFAGAGGVTSTDGWQPQAGTGGIGGTGTPGWTPNLVQSENRIVVDMEIEMN